MLLGCDAVIPLPLTRYYAKLRRVIRCVANDHERGEQDMPLPGTARFAKKNDEGAVTEFDSVGFVVAFHREKQRMGEGEGTKRNMSLRLTPRDVARLAWLSDYLDVPKTTLARELLGAALVEALDNLNILEESKDAVEAEIEALEREIIGGGS